MVNKHRWYWPWGKTKPDTTKPSTLNEAKAAIVRSKLERKRVERMRPRVDQVTEELSEEREINHMAERFRYALRGGGT